MFVNVQENKRQPFGEAVSVTNRSLGKSNNTLRDISCPFFLLSFFSIICSLANICMCLLSTCTKQGCVLGAIYTTISLAFEYFIISLYSNCIDLREQNHSLNSNPTRKIRDLERMFSFTLTCWYLFNYLYYILLSDFFSKSFYLVINQYLWRTS